MDVRTEDKDYEIEEFLNRVPAHTKARLSKMIYVLPKSER